MNFSLPLFDPSREDAPLEDATLITMRAIRARSDQHLKRATELLPPHGSIAVGGGQFDEWIIGESLAVLLGEMARSRFPMRAGEVARAFARDAVKIHNAKRPRDVNWQRHETTADDAINAAVRELERTHPF